MRLGNALDRNITSSIRFAHFCHSLLHANLLSYLRGELDGTSYVSGI